MDDPIESFHIVFCVTDGRYIAIAQNENAAMTIYRALANTTVVDEQYDVQSLRHYLTKSGYPADNIGERVFFATGGRSS